MVGATRLLVGCLLMEVSNLLGFLRSGEVYCCIFPIYWLFLRPQGGAVAPMIPIRSGWEFLFIPQALTMFPGVVPPTPVLLACHDIQLVRVLPYVASAKIFFAAGVISICGAIIISFAGGDGQELI